MWGNEKKEENAMAESSAASVAEFNNALFCYGWNFGFNGLQGREHSGNFVPVSIVLHYVEYSFQ